MDKPIIVLAGNPSWADDLRALLDQAGFALDHYLTTESYIPKLVDAHAAMIIVDGGSAAWRHWTTSPRVNAATRRIPVVVICAEDSACAEALAAGADFALLRSNLHSDLPRLIAEHARITNDAFRAEIDSQCAQPLPPEALEAINRFNAGEYYKQHDLLEALWMQEKGPIRDLYRAILQVGIAYYQVTRGNRIGALKMILRCIQWLNIMPDACQGVDVAALRADADRLRAALETWPADRDMAEFDVSLLGKVRLIDSSEGSI